METKYTPGPHYFKRGDFGDLKSVTIKVRPRRSKYAVCETFHTLEGADRGAICTFDLASFKSKREADEACRAAITKATGAA